MTEPIDFLLDTEEGQRSITITPINITPSSGILYATGQYDLKEGDVGIGVITFTTGTEWTFDGVDDINNDDVKHIAEFIRMIDHNPSALKDDLPAPQPVNAADPIVPAKTLAIIANDKGQLVDVRIEMNYPFYDVTVGGKTTARLEQDHHSNWFVSQGKLDDHLVQEIGRRITAYMLG